MKRESSTLILKRIVKSSIFLEIISFCLIFFFTKRIIYSIISLLAAAMSIFGFLLMIRLISRILKVGKGKGLFFFIGFLKLVVITLLFYPIAQISEFAVVFYILGLSIVILSIIIEGGYQIIRKQNNGT